MKKVYYIFIFLFITACELEKEIDYKTIYEGEYLIVHGYISPIEGVNIVVKKSISPDQTNMDDQVYGVEAKLYCNNALVGNLQSVGAGKYLLPFDIDFDKKGRYKVVVRAEGFDEIQSTEQQIPNQVAIDSVKVMFDYSSNTNNVIMWFTNKSLKSSYYTRYLVYLDGELQNDFYSDETPKFDFGGLLRNLPLGINADEFQFRSRFDSIKVELNQLSSDFSRFLYSLDQYDFTKDDPFFEQTYPVYSNIERGYGFFGAYNVTDTIIFLNK